ncbi:DUF5696 domain-containing protein [Fervidobacterium nodosum]|uniref:Uncharacterized protein n=1 Tax=Fervidobacterium nodosum (strain ATCC 35602 / DSM 5306 / Rt17-B1) TaxID=381764 RepID=A7HNF5_FERNB|nr:DUF5696 domain-containing protein [Fervidobacterium nodosum]ABS61438.1 hypothetical protein Fnod_1596 [Fervidobacterium nodosum Rt17-B1]PHJ14004.1 hypothetical protein IM41_03210 [Fervidobacterium sp. SC_NGM5_G05]
MSGFQGKYKFLFTIIYLLVGYLSFSQAIGNEFLSNRFTRPEKYVDVNSPFTLEGYTKIGESSALELWIDLKTTSLRVVDKRSGYIWGDVVTTHEAFSEMNDTWKAIAKSIVLIEYFDDRGISNVIGSADESVQKSYSRVNDGIDFKFNFKKVDISFLLSVRLSGDRIVFQLKNGTIKESGKYTLASVIFAPFLGSTVSNEIDGYVFVPDGPGALIRFSKPAHYLNWFEKRVYGKDYGIDNLASVNDLRSKRPNDFLREEPSILTPVFGIVHGVKRNAIFGVVTSGKEYSSIVAYPSGILSLYNWVSAKFIYRQKYLQPTSRSGAGIQVAQKDMNKFDAKLEVSFLAGNDADYVGMAKYYRDNYLKNILVKKIVGSNVPVAISLIASDIEKRVIGYRTMPITTFKQIEKIVSELKNSGIGNLKVIINGWQKGGIHGNKISKLSFEDSLGDIDDLINFVKNGKKNGYDVYLLDNVTKVTEKQINLKKEVGINLSQSVIYEDRDNRELWIYRSYYTNIVLASQYVSEKLTKLSEKGISNFALNEYGSKLYGDLKYGHEFFRSDALKLVERTLENISKKTDSLYLSNPNDYTWKYVDGILDIPMNCSQYLFETDTVPFLQIVLSGSIDYFAPYVNNSFFSRIDILKMIEYGALPSFLLTWVDNYLIKKTPLWDYPSTKYEDWKVKITEIYKEVSDALKNVRGSKIIDRFVVEPGIIVVSYNNGKSIVVNYTSKTYILNDQKIKPQSWIVTNSNSINVGVGQNE